MKNKPILFSGPMVRAILEGRKTQTRRIIKPQPDKNEKIDKCHWVETGWSTWKDGGCSCRPVKCPYGQPDDLLMVASKILGVPSTYCAGINGRIYSRARGDWRPLKSWRQPKGYESVTIMNGGKKKTMSIHRLVCSAFYGPPPLPSSQVRHIDGNPENGKPENLAWGSQAENWQDRRVHGNGCEGEKHHDAKFTDEERVHIRWAIQKRLCSQRHVARALHVSQSAIHGIMNANETIIVKQDIPPNRIPEITLEIKDIRVEMLQDISEEDAISEGISCIGERKFVLLPGNTPSFGLKGDDPENGADTAWGAFVLLWNSINGPDSWKENPWVWVVSFDVHPVNIDDFIAAKEAA